MPTKDGEREIRKRERDRDRENLQRKGAKQASLFVY